MELRYKNLETKGSSEKERIFQETKTKARRSFIRSKQLVNCQESQQKLEDLLKTIKINT